MNGPHHSPRSRSTLWRRVATAALLLLQVMVAFSPVVERQGTIRQVTHAHDQQRHHGLTHDDTNCAVCAARTQVAEAAELPAVAMVAEPPRAPAVADLPAAPPREPRGANPSRAPPVLG